jgi:hypothetical protein
MRDQPAEPDLASVALRFGVLLELVWDMTKK